MRTMKVAHQNLPGVGELFELATASGVTFSVINHRTGRRQLAVHDGDPDAPRVVASLTRAEAAALAALLTGAHIELVSVPRRRPPS